MNSKQNSKHYNSMAKTDETKSLIREEVRSYLNTIINDYSDDEFEDFLRAKRYDKIIEDIENNKREIISTTKEDFLKTLNENV